MAERQVRDLGQFTDVQSGDEVVTARGSTTGRTPSRLLKEIDDGAVTRSKIANDAVDSRKLAAGAVTEAIIADDAVTGDKIPRDAIDQDHLAADSVGNSEMRADAVDTVEIVNDAVTEPKLAPAVRTKLNAESGAQLSGSIPEPPGTPASGTANLASRDDHVHPVATGAQIKGRLEALTGDDRLSYSAVKDTPVIPPYSDITVRPGGIADHVYPESIEVSFARKTTSKSFRTVALTLGGQPGQLDSETPISGLTSFGRLKFNFAELSRTSLNEASVREDREEVEGTLTFTFTDGTQAFYNFPFPVNNPLFAAPSGGTGDSVAARVYTSTQSGVVLPSVEVTPGRRSSQMRVLLEWRGRHDSIATTPQHILIRRGTTEIARDTQDYVVSGRYEKRLLQTVDMPLTTNTITYTGFPVGKDAAENIDYRDMKLTVIDYGATPAPTTQQSPGVTAFPRHAWYFRWVESSAAAPTFQGATWSQGNFYNIPAGLEYNLSASTGGFGLDAVYRIRGCRFPWKCVGICSEQHTGIEHLVLDC